MTSSRPSILCALPLLAGACWATGALAQSSPTAPVPAAPASDTDVRRLSDEERLAILDHITPESAALARGEDPGAPLRGIHGEVGAMVGTNGARALYGTAAIPLGDNAEAVVSFETSRFGTYRR